MKAQPYAGQPLNRIHAPNSLWAATSKGWQRLDHFWAGSMLCFVLEHDGTRNAVSRTVVSHWGADGRIYVGTAEQIAATALPTGGAEDREDAHQLHRELGAARVGDHRAFCKTVLGYRPERISLLTQQERDQVRRALAVRQRRGLVAYA